MLRANTKIKKGRFNTICSKSGNASYHSVQSCLSSSLLSAVVLCGCKTWSLTLREENMLRVSENKLLRRKFGPKREEVTGVWRRLHNEKLNDLY